MDHAAKCNTVRAFPKRLAKNTYVGGECCLTTHRAFYLITIVIVITKTRRHLGYRRGVFKL
jgi:hypothetical protein